MRSLRLLWVVAPLFLGACSFVNAPDDPIAGTTTSGSGGAGASGGEGGTTSSSGGGGATTTSDPSICGDGKLTGAEGCDDDNTVAGDGCSAKCEVEPGYACTDAMDELSTCEKLCGNGTVDMGEQCDDGNMGDTNPAVGDQDFCDPMCQFKEFDIEAGMGLTVNNAAPAVAFRKDGEATFYVVWHASAVGKIQGRQYKFDGTYKKGTGVDELSTSPNPDPSGHRMCTAPGNRSLVFWRDVTEKKLYSRKIESNGDILDAVVTGIPVPEQRMSCAAAMGNTFIAVTTSKVTSALWNVNLQPFNSFAAPSPTILDIGDSLGTSDISTWDVGAGFLTAWIADGPGKGPINAQQLDANGAALDGLIFTMSDVDDVAPREPWGARLGTQDQFAVAYTRDSVPDVSGAVHREVAVRIFKAPDDGGKSFLVTADLSPQTQPRLVTNPASKKLVVIWTGGQVGSENVFYRVFDENGMPLTDEKPTGDVLAGQQTLGAGTVDPATGDVAIVWDNFTPNSGKPHKVSAKIFPGLLK